MSQSKNKMPNEQDNNKGPDNGANPCEDLDDLEFIDLDAEPDRTEDEIAGRPLCFRVGNNLKFNRLDKYLGGRFSQFSRTRLQKMIKEQGVNVNGRPAKISHKLMAGDKIDLVLPPKEIRELIPQDIPINVIYEDDDLIVVNKQADLIVHPARGYKHSTLVNGLVYHFQTLSSGSDEMRPGVVHRLDRNTTGCLVVAKTDNAHLKLSRQFANRTTKKTYLAVVHGCPELDGDVINKPLGVHPTVREKYAIRTDEGMGKNAITFYEVLERFKGYSLVKVNIKTGRTHQIRVHMQHIKHSVVADDMYGGKVVYPWQIENRDPMPEEPLLARTALHAWKLEVDHPTTGERMEFEAPLPPDIQKLVDELRKHRAL